jgi:hypothetical protein
MLVTVWICPTPGCFDYYGASSAGNLFKERTYPRAENVGAFRDMHGRDYVCTRATCPSCRQRGLSVERVPVSIEVNRPSAVATPTGP